MSGRSAIAAASTGFPPAGVACAATTTKTKTTTTTA